MEVHMINFILWTYSSEKYLLGKIKMQIKVG